MFDTRCIVPAVAQNKDAIRDMLSAEKLPVSDLPETMDNFLIATDNDMILGSIGLEVYGENGFLRSMVVKPAFRNRKIAGKLVERLEAKATQLRLKTMYLLTESAAGFFERKGYQSVRREDLPLALQQSSEFTHTCPQSAIAMYKKL